jgi:hypothetical protein
VVKVILVATIEGDNIKFTTTNEAVPGLNAVVPKFNV